MDTMRFNYYFDHKDGKVIIDQTDWDYILLTLMGKGIEIKQNAAQHRMHLTAFGVGVLAFLAGFGVCWLAFVR